MPPLSHHPVIARPQAKARHHPFEALLDGVCHAGASGWMAGLLRRYAPRNDGEGRHAFAERHNKRIGTVQSFLGDSIPQTPCQRDFVVPALSRCHATACIALCGNEPLPHCLRSGAFPSATPGIGRQIFTSFRFGSPSGCASLAALRRVSRADSSNPCPLSPPYRSGAHIRHRRRSAPVLRTPA